ncbi:MAG TPA: COX15/CtaA family protein [Gemmatimonadaceae bacterium]|nr:COX15/CtaA family protein [Gemmatimonadaceae bacterium]
MLRRFAWSVVGYNLLVIAWGAYVRASGSGAGCGSHWPLCNGTVVPRAPRIETMIELTHRATSGLAAIAVFALLWWTFRAKSAGHPARSAAVASAVLIVVEALLGAGLVLFGWVEDDASWGRVAALGLHLANTFLLLAALTLTAWRLSDQPAHRWSARGPDGATIATLLTLIMCVAVTGAMTSLGDTLFPAASLSEGLRSDFEATSHFLERLRVIHPALAILTALAVIVGSRAIAARSTSPTTAALARATQLLVTLQVAGGVLNLALLAPIWMQLVHLLLADITWIALVLLGASTLAIRSEGEPPLRAA